MLRIFLLLRRYNIFLIRILFLATARAHAGALLDAFQRADIVFIIFLCLRRR